MKPNTFTVVPAAYVIFRKDDKILLLRRVNTGYRDGFYAFPAGHLDGGETAAQAAIREAKEEVGVSILPADLKFAHVVHRVAEEGNHERVDFFFTASNWTGDPYIAEPEKCDDLKWFSVTELPQKSSPIIQHVLDQITEGKAYSEDNFSS